MNINMNGSAVITAKNLSAGYPGQTVWHQANFSVWPGEFVAVVGPNGAGKTTLLRLLLGLEPPLAGTLSMFNSALLPGNPRIGYIPQRHQIDSELNIETIEFVRLGVDGNRWGFTWSDNGNVKAQEALKLVGAAELTHRPLGQLSGGELQRVFLAQALVGEPDVLLLDEPLSNLDIKREADFVKLINKIVRSRGVTVLLIAHNINPLLPVLDRVIYIANGQVATGRPQEVLTSESLTKLYNTPVEVLRDSHGRLAIIGTDEAAHHYD